MSATPGSRAHLRDIATICPATMRLSTGLILTRCELDQGHDGRHKDGCSLWPDSAAHYPDTTPEEPRP